MIKQHKEQLQKLIMNRCGIVVNRIRKSGDGFNIYINNDPSMYLHLFKAENKSFDLCLLGHSTKTLEQFSQLDTIIKSGIYKDLMDLKNIFDSSKVKIPIDIGVIDIASGPLAEIEKSKPMCWVFYITINNLKEQYPSMYTLKIKESEHFIEVTPMAPALYDNQNESNGKIVFKKEYKVEALRLIALDLIKCVHYTTTISPLFSKTDIEYLPFESFSDLKELDEVLDFYKQEMAVQNMKDI